MAQACSTPDQAVEHRAAARQEPRLGGRVSGGGGGQQRVREAIPHSSRPGLRTNTGPRAETETKAT